MARNLAMGSPTEPGSLGEISKVYSDFNFYAPEQDPYPSSFLYQRKLGGGASFLTGPYPIAAATMCFPNPPNVCKVVGQMDPMTGVDLQVGMALEFPPTSTVQGSDSPMSPMLPG